MTAESASPPPNLPPDLPSEAPTAPTTPLAPSTPLPLPAAPALPLGAQTLQALQELLHQGEAANTRRSYQSAMRYWTAWLQLRLGQPMALPLSVEVVLQFITDHAPRQTAQGLATTLPPEVDAALVAVGCKTRMGWPAHATLVHRLAVLSKAHQNQHLPNPCQDPHVRQLLASARKAAARQGLHEKKQDALTKDKLQQLLATCDTSAKGVRDKALLLFAWSSGGRRRSEVAQADMQFLRRLGSAHFSYELRLSKSNQSGRSAPENFKPVLGMAGQALEDWLHLSGIRSGPLFRRIRKGGVIGTTALSPAAVRLIVQERCQLAGVQGDFSAHSLRSGFVTEAGRRNVPLAQTMALTGHHSIATVMGYFRAEEGLHNGAARLMDDGDGDGDGDSAPGFG